MLNLLHLPLPELFAVLAAVAFAAGLNLYATVAVLGLLARFRTRPPPASSRAPANLALNRSQHNSLRHRILRRQNPHLRPDLERPPHLRPSPGSRPPGLRSHPPTNPRRTTPSCRPGSSHSPNRSLRQNRPPRRRNPIPRALLQHHPKPRRGRPGHLSNLASHPPSLRGGNNRVGPGSSNSVAGKSSDPSHAQAVPRRRRRIGRKVAPASRRSR